MAKFSALFDRYMIAFQCNPPAIIRNHFTYCTVIIIALPVRVNDICTVAAAPSLTSIDIGGN
ncbi:hypothetical protein AI2717V1_5095 (plasmid) [Klebsiella pneumoniae]|nr:hypothetical protein AI2717V1_5095 [Klebsiella pneumoniae]CAE7143334.1 hypothetical protein AI2700V1_5153 [Klebsiella pneumoniae]CAF3152117.1 hypothetical protein AI2979V1_5159 [Klebsiella pneumoniae]CAF3184506.1 hypothetical protein AI2985V1_5157 [Klebsiella pneumoniae]CAF9738536.1 hypothetical protein AI3060V5_5161 [Klebsiella pneumoniae]